MSEMTVVECDYKDGECSRRFEGFTLHVDQSSKTRILTEAGWTVVDDKHYCPEHSEETGHE